MLRNLLLPTVLLAVLAVSPGQCASVKMDLLAGVGDFEYCADTAWNVHAHPDYDFDAQSGWVGDYRSTISLKQTPVTRRGGSGSGDAITVVCATSDGRSSNVTYEFTDGGGARAGCSEIAVPSGAGPDTAAARLAEAVTAHQGRQGSGAVAAGSTGGTVWVKPVLGWQIRTLGDSDASEARIVSSSATWRHGFDRATPDNSVAVGWVKKTGETVHPRNNAVYRIAVGQGAGGSNCQYFALKDYTGGHGTAYLSTNLKVDDRPGSLHTGDRVAFRVDYLRTSGCGDLGGGAQAQVKIGIRWADQLFEREVPITRNVVSAEVSAGPISGLVSEISAHVRIDIIGDAPGKEPGVYVDGAQMFVTRAGRTEPEVWEIPVRRNRSCRTTKLFCRPDSEHDPYQIATDYDSIMLEEKASRYIPLFRYLNPDMKIYLYESVTSTDLRDARGNDPWYTNCPVSMGYILANGRTDWLYDNNAGFYVAEPYYPTSYCTRLAKPAFQALWAQNAADRAKRWRYDGVWIDALMPLQEIRNGSRLLQPSRDPWEVQQFLRAVLPVLRGAVAEVIHNTCGARLESGPGGPFSNPHWTPVSPYTSQEYRAASPATVADVLLQEWAFFYTDMANGRAVKHDRDYWKGCLDDMDAVERWNTASGDGALGSGYSKRYHLIVTGTDSTTDPAYAADGWLQFGLCSYLLGQNDWTVFGYGVRSTCFANWDLSVTKRLGAPDSDHAACNGDPYFRYRLYRPTTDGGVGGVVVVNANPDARSYLLGFDAVDESGSPVPSNSAVVLKPHTGRIFLRRQPVINTTMAGPGSVGPGRTVSISVGYLNNTGEAVRDLVLRVAVPAEMTYVAGSAEVSGGSYDSATNTVRWVIPSAAPGASGTRTFSALAK